MKAILIKTIKLYQKYLSHLKPGKCRFYPTCSQYAIDSIEKYGVLNGCLYSVRRIIKCHPFNPGGYDPVK